MYIRITIKEFTQECANVRKNILNLVNKRNSLFAYSVGLHKKELAKTFHIRHLAILSSIS